MNIGFEDDVREYAAKLTDEGKAELLETMLNLAEDPWFGDEREIRHEEDGEVYLSYELDLPGIRHVVAYSVDEGESTVTLTELRPAA